MVRFCLIAAVSDELFRSLLASRYDADTLVSPNSHVRPPDGVDASTTENVAPTPTRSVRP